MSRFQLRSTTMTGRAVPIVRDCAVLSLLLVLYATVALASTTTTASARPSTR